MRAKIGSNECLWGENSYWYGNTAVFKDCAAGLKTNKTCGSGARNVVCYIDTALCDQKGADKILDIDVVSATKPPPPPAACSIQITSKNCSYDPILNKYNVYLGIKWSGGSYAKGEIDNTESKNYTIANFVYSAQSNNAGTKQLSAFVFDNNNNVLCTNSTDIYCTPEKVGPTITNTSVEILGIAVSDSCPEEKSHIDVICTSSIPKVDCIRAKIGNSICVWGNDSYWYGNDAVFKNCASGFKTNTVCGNNSREVRCYIDKTKCSQTGSDKTLGIDVMPTTKLPIPSVACNVEIISKSCSYDPIIKRYTTIMDVKWTGGEHAHGKIEEQESMKYTTPEFIYMYQSGTPGTRNLKAYVHDKDNRVLCYNTSSIYCGTGNTTGVVLDVIRHMPDVARPGWIDVKFDIAPYKLIQNFEFKEYVKKDLIVANRTIEGNISETIFSGPETISEGYEDFHVYSWRTDLDEGKNATISYKIKIDQEGEYHFLSKARFFDQEKKDDKYLFVTTCPQTTPVFAKNPTTGDCQQFKTACKAAEMGYEIVESCIELPEPQPPEEKFDWISVIIVIIIAAILALVWVKREEIKEKIDEWRYSEEKPSKSEF
jgi:hypothetical protein